MKTFGWIIAAPILLLLVWFGSAFVYETTQSYVHRFRVTIEVDTPSGIKSASGVWESAWGRKAHWIPQTGGAIGNLRRGEAVFVDLGAGRHVIAILGLGPTGSDQGIERLAARAFGRERPLWFVDAPNWQGSAELNPRDIPTLVTFSDLNDPATARVVAPDNFEAVFGPGVRFKRATIEMVPAGVWPLTLFGIGGEPVTRGIENWLGHVLAALEKYNRMVMDPRDSRNYRARTGHFVRN